MRRGRGLGEGRAAALFAVGEQRELRHDENLARYIVEGEVGLAFRVIVDAQGKDLAPELLAVSRVSA